VLDTNYTNKHEFPKRKEIGERSCNSCTKRLTQGEHRDFDDGMKSRRILVTALVVLPIVLVCNLPGKAFAAAFDDDAVRQADIAWSAAAGSKDLDKTVSFYSEDALVLPPNEPAVTGKDGIRKLWSGFLDSITTIRWKPTRIEIANSGEMAVLTGIYDMTMKDGNKDRVKYCEVWKQKSDGTWKCTVDMFSSDSPATPATATSPEKK